MSTPRPICHIFTPIGMVGYGFSVEEMHDTLRSLTEGPGSDVPTAIICDSGSTDSGPRKLAVGDMTAPRAAYKRDLGWLVEGVKKYGTPLLIGSAGGAGLDTHVQELTKILDEVSKENEYDLKVVQIFSSIDKSLVSSRLSVGAISPCGSGVPALEQQDLDDCSAVVAQMGPEPYISAIDHCPDFDVILGGRAYDPAPYVAFANACLRKLDRDPHDKDYTGRLQGAIMHVGKILECGGLCAVPKSTGAIATIFDDGSFDVRPTNPLARCTALSVAAHSLYEKSRPDMLFGPGGYLDLRKSTFVENIDGSSVHVSGSVFRTSEDQGNPFQVKLEGARNNGYRAIYIGFIRDPILILQIDSYLESVKDKVQSQLSSALKEGTWDLKWHIYGHDTHGKASGDVFLVGESRAETQALARSIVATARTWTIHNSYPGQKATSGSFGFGIGGVNEIETGPCAEFCVYHLMDLLAGEEVSLFPFKILEMKHGKDVPKSHASHIAQANGTHVPKPKEVHLVNRPKKESKIETQSYKPRTLGNAAKILRSKNSGPYEITFDVMFDQPEVYELVKSSGILSKAVIEKLYDTDNIVYSGFFDPALAFKATIPRPRPSGGYFEDDVHGSQMYIPLMRLELPDALREQLANLDNSAST